MDGPRRRRLKRQLDSTIIHFVGPHSALSNDQASHCPSLHSLTKHAWTPWTPALAIVVIACVCLYSASLTYYLYAFRTMYVLPCAPRVINYVQMTGT